MTIQLSKLTPDPVDPRDYLFEPTPGDILFGENPNVTLPNAVDLRNFCRPIESQGGLGSCTAAATCACAEMFDTSTDRSKLFNYYTSRQLLSAPYNTSDYGSTARVALKAANQSGLPNEALWPYDLSKWAVSPSQQAYDDALLHRVTEYYRIATLSVSESDVIKTIKYAMATGYPVLISANVGTTLQALPATSTYQRVSYPDNPLWGQHEFLLVGYNDAGNYFIAKNSWGTSWCDGGYFKVSQEMAFQDALDLWVMKGFNGISTVGPKQIMYPPKPTPEDIAIFLNAYLTTDVQLIITTAIWYRLSAGELESAMGWATGSVRLYKDTIGQGYNWDGFIW